MSNFTAQLKLWKLPPWYLRAYQILIFSVFFLIALGGTVRVMKAGLACPDWPLCFGDVIPDYHPQVYFEFMHRVVAGLVAIVTVVLQWFLFRSQAPRHLKYLAGFSLVILVAQIVFGGLTVILLLKSGVVATHLLLGTGFFGLLFWIYLSLRSPAKFMVSGPGWMRYQTLGMSVAVYGQIFLGGLVAANYAALVCVDFPKCHGEWFPTFSGIIGLHVIHRLGAYTIFVLSVLNWLSMRRFATDPQLKSIAALLFYHVCGQVALGIANVLFLTPPVLAVGHLALGVAVFAMTLKQLHSTRDLWSFQAAPLRAANYA